MMVGSSDEDVAHEAELNAFDNSDARNWLITSLLTRLMVSPTSVDCFDRRAHKGHTSGIFKKFVVF